MTTTVYLAQDRAAATRAAKTLRGCGIKALVRENPYRGLFRYTVVVPRGEGRLAQFILTDRS